VPEITGAGAGRTFAARGRFLGIDYAFTNLGRVPVRPARLNGLFGVAGASAATVTPISGTSTCGPALPAYGAEFAGLTPPTTAVRPHRTVSTFALYALPPGVASGRGELAHHRFDWVSSVLNRDLPLQLGSQVR
jgi:hypothetical protein